jgi:hypothetical protein
MIDWLITCGFGALLNSPNAPRPLLTGRLCPLTLYGSPVALLKFQMASRLTFLIISGSRKKQPRYTCLSEAKASHWQRIWAEVSSSAPHVLHNGLSISPIKWRCLLRILCPVRRPVAALDCILLKDKSLAFVPRQGPEINSRACLWILPRLSLKMKVPWFFRTFRIPYPATQHHIPDMNPWHDAYFSLFTAMVLCGDQSNLKHSASSEIA